MELFYDLVFVVAVAQISHHLAEHVTWQGAGEFVLLFVAVWWVWVMGTIYNERFESRGLEARLFTFLQLVGVGSIAFFAHDGAGHNATGFALSYVGTSLLILCFWIRGAIHNPPFRPVLWGYLLGFLPSHGLWIASIWVDGPGKHALWAAGLLGVLLTPLLTLRIQARLPRFSTSKLPERFGLFVIIVLGEGIVGSINGLAAHEHLDVHLAVAGVLSIAVPFCLWWIYFDFIARRVPRPNGYNVFFWGTIFHMPLVLGIAASGAGLLNLVARASAGVLPLEVQALLGTSIGCALTSIALIETRLARTAHEPTHPAISPLLKVFTGGAIAALGLLAPPMHTYWFMLPILALMSINMVYGAWVWFHNPAHHSETHYVG